MNNRCPYCEDDLCGCPRPAPSTRYLDYRDGIDPEMFTDKEEDE